jgi:chemotaxis protein CheC
MVKSPISELEKRIFQKAGEIAATSAADALSKLIGEKININVTDCKKVEINSIPTIFGDKDRKVVAINMLIPTNNLCTVLMLIPSDEAMRICDMFSKRELGTTKEITYERWSELFEIGNISICAYLNSLSNLINEKLIPTPPAVAFDSMTSILEDVAVSADTVTMDNKAVLIESDFKLNDVKCNGYFIFIPDRDFTDSILKVFNVSGKE